MTEPPQPREAIDLRATWTGVVWSNAAFVATRSMSFLAVVILARLLDPADFGLVAVVVVVLAVLELGSDLGMRASVIYEQERGVTERVQTAFTLGLLVAAALTALGLLLAPLLAGVFGIDGVTPLLRLAVLNILLTGLGNVHDALLLREMALRRRTVSEVVRGAVRAGVSIGLALAGFGASSLVWGMLAGTAAWTVTLWWLTRFIPSLSLDRRIARSMAGYGLGASALDALAAVTTRLDTVVIGRVLGQSALGLYTIAFRIPELLIQSIAWNVSAAVFPALSRQRVREREGLGAMTVSLVRYHALYALPMAAALFVLAGPLVAVLFGPKWEQASGVLAAIAVMTAISATAHPVGDLLKAVAKQRLLILANFLLVPATIVAIVFAAGRGIEAVAWARVASVAAFGLLVAVLAARSVGFRLPAAAFALAPGLAAAVGVGLAAGAVRVAWPAPSLLPLIAGVVAGAVGGAVGLRVLAPATFRSGAALIRSQIGRMPGRVPVG